MPDVYSLRILPSARRELESLHDPLLRRVAASMRHLAVDPRPRGSRKLVGTHADYRVRVGDYRIVYEVDDRQRTVTIYRVRHRSQVYE